MAHLWERGIAFLLDSVIASWVVVVTVAINPLPNEGLSAILVPILLLLIPFSQLVYFVFLEGLFRLSTPGKRIMGLKVFRDDWRTPTRIQCIGRNLLRIVDSLPTIYLVGIVSMTYDSLGRRIGDRLAGTMVVRRKGREISVWPLVLLIIFHVPIFPISLSMLMASQNRPGHARIEVKVQSALPIFIDDGDAGFSVVLLIKNVGDAEAERCRVNFLACPEYVLPPSHEDLFIGDIRPGQSIQTILKLGLTSKRDKEFVVVVQVNSDKKASGGINIPVSLRSD